MKFNTYFVLHKCFMVEIHVTCIYLNLKNIVQHFRKLKEKCQELFSVVVIQKSRKCVFSPPNPDIQRFYHCSTTVHERVISAVP